MIQLTEAQHAALLADRARLDYLEANGTSDYGEPIPLATERRWFNWRDGCPNYTATLREAIDNTMRVHPTETTT